MISHIRHWRLFRQAEWRSQNDLSRLSDWTLRDIGMVRATSTLESVKPFWLS